MKPYYYVYRCGHGKPRIKHDTLESARSEAERLASSHPGEAFEILKCVAVSGSSKISTFWMDGEGPATVAKAATVQPDKDGWIEHDPNGPEPYMHRGVRFGDGTENLDCSINWRRWRWTHSHSSKGEHITHYKPWTNY